MASLVGNPRREKSARWLLVCFYLLLVLGGITMVYPFWMMVSGSLSSGLDYKDRALVPKYLLDRNELFLKFLLNRYSNRQLLSQIYHVDGVLRPSDLRNRLRAPSKIPPSGMLGDWRQFRREAANPSYLTLADPSVMVSRYQTFLERKFADHVPQGMDFDAWETLEPIERMNRAYAQMAQTFAFAQLPPWNFGQVADEKSEPIYADFVEFLKLVPVENLLPVSGASIWETWLENRYPGQKLEETALEFRPDGPRDPKTQEDWKDFLQTAWPDSLMVDGKLICPETDWRKFLRSKYRTDAELATAWSDPYAKIETAPLPYQAEDAFLFVGNEWRLRWHLATENYARVGAFLVERGRAMQNTVILVTLSILVALVINPLAAYGLSRYPGRHGRVTLLVMVLTIAFPSEVAMIPSFLLLRDFNLLNSYAALILPGAVSGFSVFLLKGFFDGLPEELFESATIEGASEIELFWHVALPLSRPILAVIALGTFTATYSGFMWALLVCQDERMWTLMVWLFQFQMNYADQPWLGMAAFVFASIPTLLVFIFCQRLILRAVIIPTEK